MQIPEPRGRFSGALAEVLATPPHPVPDLVPLAEQAVAHADDVLFDEDVQLGLAVLYELHYRGVHRVDDDWEWEPSLLAARAVLEASFESGLRARFDRRALHTIRPDTVARTLFDLTDAPGGPSVATFIAREATAEQVREMCVLRSIYQLKEADPHSWALPRLHGPAKAALVEIQSDEYGNGRLGRMHSELFAGTLRALGLDGGYGAYVDDAPALTLASANVMHLFGLHRRLRGALLGHLAAYEMTSSAPCRQYAIGVRRLGLPEEAAAFFDEHVEADAIHEQLAGHDLCGNLVAAEPHLAGDVLFGAVACLGVDELVGEMVLAAWRSGRSPLRRREGVDVGHRSRRGVVSA